MLTSEKDPFSRLFDMYVVHGTAQLSLAQKLLALSATQATRKTFDDKLQKGGLSKAEEERIDRLFGEADAKIDKLSDDIKELIESLTGVSLDTIQDANL